MEFLKLHQFLHSKEKDILTELREEGKALNEEMELNLSQLQEQCLLAKDMLVSIQAKTEQQNSFDFLKVRIHTNMIMGTFLPRGGKRFGKNTEVAFHIQGKQNKTKQLSSAFKFLWKKRRRLLQLYAQQKALLSSS